MTPHPATHIVPASVYYRVFAALMALTGITVAAALFDLGWLNPLVAVAIAVIKAVLVVLFFMHVRYSSRLTWVVIVSGLFWFGILVVLTLTDYTTRNLLGIPPL